VAKRRCQTREAKALHWRSLIRRWQRSGLKQTEFCRRARVSIFRFRWWKRRVGRQGKPKGIPLLPVEVVGRRDIGAAGPIEVELRSGRVIRIPAGTEPVEVGRLVAAVEAVPC
jgi:hypothetical protein